MVVVVAKGTAPFTACSQVWRSFGGGREEKRKGHSSYSVKKRKVCEICNGFTRNEKKEERNPAATHVAAPAIPSQFSRIQGSVLSQYCLRNTSLAAHAPKESSNNNKRKYIERDDLSEFGNRFSDETLL
ncbi:hypothetical protein llap_1101 [Limosa lapponica baueri]|uniref:Uncharacterized protein n=1 Tax=Limosa lapponica baueri TaxID=1758121 RepID=A0A2I0UR92_LIMLA|nr:hypothetical protein llap_1101 [Limosa lapponica baueri]